MSRNHWKNSVSRTFKALDTSYTNAKYAFTDLNDFTTYAFLETIANTQTIKAKSQERSYCSSQSVQHKSFILNKENRATLLCGRFHVGVKSTADLDLKLQHWRHKRLLMCVGFFPGIFCRGTWTLHQREPFQGGLECDAVAELRQQRNHPAQLDKRNPRDFTAIHTLTSKLLRITHVMMLWQCDRQLYCSLNQSVTLKISSLTIYEG